MKVRWNVRTLAVAKGIDNASQLAVYAGLTYPVATRVYASEETTRVDLLTLGKLAKAFGCKRNPWKLLEILSV